MKKESVSFCGFEDRNYNDYSSTEREFLENLIVLKLLCNIVQNV